MSTVESSGLKEPVTIAPNEYSQVRTIDGYNTVKTSTASFISMSDELTINAPAPATPFESLSKSNHRKPKKTLHKRKV